MKKIVAVAKKEKQGIVKLPVGHRHKEIPGKGEKGFIDTSGKFENRKEAEKTAKKAKEIKSGKEEKKLHSRDLKQYHEKGKKK